jgi:type I restriction enzyme S subunit
VTDWRDVTLADVCSSVDYGYTASSSLEVVGPKFLRITDIAGPSLDWVDVPYCEIDDRAFEKFRLVEGDIVVARTGATVGYGRWVSPPEPSVFASYLVRFRPSDDVSARFIGHVVESSAYKEFVKRSAGGAAQPNANAKVLGSFPFRLPDRASQDRIVSLVQPIDDLIENNRRRIALVEKMAQTIYREWFVHFRYRGHEKDELVDSHLGPSPAGWRAARLGDVIELRYGKALKASARKGGPVAVVGSSGVVGWHNESLVSGPAVVVGRKGNVGSVMWIQGESWPIDTTYYVTTDLPLHFIYRMLSEIEFIDSHAAVPGLSRDQAYSIDVLRPDIEVAALFEDTASELSAIGSVLERQAAVLSRVRDALLPKLITGAIDVSNLDLDVLLEAA